jgi:acetyl esterase/lipase
MTAKRRMPGVPPWTLLLVLAGAAVAVAAEPEPRTIELWPEGAPGARGASDEDKPAITAYLPDPARSTGTAVLICPGGGFLTRAVDHEGVLVARWFQARGVAGFVLRYRIRPIYTTEESLQDARRGLRSLRAHADGFGIDPDRIGVIGFSAGAVLAAHVALRPQPGTSDASDAVERQPSRAAFQVLAYGSPGLLGPAGRADSSAQEPMRWGAAPPTFLFCTTEDAAIARGMTDLYANLARAGIPVEAHFFARGVHGVGLAQGDPVRGVWPELMWTWLRAGGLLTRAPRVAIRGVVTLDGEPLARGTVIFTPLEVPAAPPVVALVFNTGPVRGEFMVPASQGPTPGRYRVEVRQDAARWVSNARDPVIGRLAAKMKGGTITDDERREWVAYARKRDLAPSLGDQRVFRARHPGDRTDMIVEFKAGGESRVDVAVFTR